MLEATGFMMKVSVLPVNTSHQMQDNSEEDMPSNKQENTEVKTNSDLHGTYVKTKMFKAMKPLFTSLQLFGMFYFPKYNTDITPIEKSNAQINGKHFQRKTTSRCQITWSMLYSWLFLLLLTIHFGRLFTIFSYGALDFGVFLLNKLIMICYNGGLLLYLVMCIRAAHCVNKLHKFFWGIEEVLQQSPDDKELEFVRKFTIIAVCISWTCTVIGMCLMSYCVWFYPIAVEPMFAPLTVDDPALLVAKILVQFFLPLHTAVFWFPMTFDCIMCACLYIMFSCWNKRFREKCSTGISTHEFVKERIVHQKICRLVGHADDCLALYEVTNFISNIANVLFILFILINLPPYMNNFAAVLLYMIWFVICLFSLIVTSVSSAVVNHVVSSKYQIFCTMLTKDTSNLV